MNPSTSFAIPPASISELPVWPHYAPDEIAAAMRTLQSGKVNYWTGTEAREFEHEYARYTGTRYAIALANGTVSLELALATLGVGPGDEVITTPRTFIASASCAVMRGAKPVFADVDPDSQNITAQTIAKVLNERTRAIIVVHLAGWPCEMDAILELAAAHQIPVIEDCAQSHGAQYRNQPVGGLGTFGSFSFCQDKIITTGGEGGMLVLNDPEHWARSWSYKDHGKSFDAVYHREHGPGFRWLHESFGTNFRLTEMQAAIGRCQLAKLDGWIDKRRKNAQQLASILRTSGLRIPEPPAHIRHAYYKFYAFVRPEQLRPGWTRDRIVTTITSRGVPCFSGSCSEIYMEKAFERAALRPAERLPIARELGETSLMLLVHPTLDSEDIEHVGHVAGEVLADALR